MANSQEFSHATIGVVARIAALLKIDIQALHNATVGKFDAPRHDAFLRDADKALTS